MLKYNSFAYEQPFRPNYEAYEITIYLSGSLVSFATSMFVQIDNMPFLAISAVCAGMSLRYFKGAYQLHQIQKNLGGRTLTFITINELQELIKKRPLEMWLGYGFEWQPTHVQRMYEISKRDWAQVEQRYIESSFAKLWREYITKKPEPEAAMGKAWIHGVEPNEKRIFQPLKHIEGHTLIIGTTGSGKTRLFDILISQCILRGEAVIIIDPKGDKELAQNAKQCCIAMGKPEHFVYFNAAFPQESTRINPLRNFSRVTEIASRISALMQSANGGNDPFKAFSWQALNNIVQGLAMIEGRPTLVKIKHFLEGGAQGLVIQCIKKWLTDCNISIDKAIEMLPEKKADSRKRGFTQESARYFLEDGTDNDKATALVFIFQEHIVKQYPNPDLESLVSMFTHDQTHFSKMVANLLPIMNMLTSGVLGQLLSPNTDDLTDKRPYTDTDKIISQNQVAYIGLDSLTDSIVGSAIGSMLLSDLTAVAGERYNYGDNLKPVNIFIDEAAETINEPMIAMLNKGRGAKMRLYVATQTIADFSAKLGSKDKAMQVLGNVNNTIALRTIDPETQEYICESLPKTRISYVMRSQSQGGDSNMPLLHSGSLSETLKEEEADYFPAAQLGALPNLEYIAKISGGKVIKGRLPILIDEIQSNSKNHFIKKMQKYLRDKLDDYEQKKEIKSKKYWKGKK